MTLEKFKDRPLGVIPSPPDERNYCLADILPADKLIETFPKEYMVPNLPPSPYDQGYTSMCVAFSLKAIKEMQEAKEREIYTKYSAGFIYGNRHENDSVGEGMYPDQALKNLLKEGVCKESTYPVMGTFYACQRGITEAMHGEALPQKIAAYAQLKWADEIKNALMNIGPVLFCIPVYESFYNGGHLLLPNKSKERLYGYHAVVCVGWTKDDRWIILNSWGVGWGLLNGYCTFTYDYPIIEKWSVTDYVAIPPNSILYRIQAGAFSNITYANNRLKLLELAGYDFNIVIEDALYKIRSVDTYTKEESKEVITQITKDTGVVPFKVKI